MSGPLDTPWRPSMPGFGRYLHQQAWNTAIAWLSHRAPYKPSPPTAKYKANHNHRWLQLRQWHLGELLLFLHLLRPRSPERLELAAKIEPLLDMFKLHIGQQDDARTSIITDDKAERELYEATLFSAQNAVVLPDNVAECLRVVGDMEETIDALEEELQLTKLQQRLWKSRVHRARRHSEYIPSEATTRDVTPVPEGFVGGPDRQLVQDEGLRPTDSKMDTDELDPDWRA